MINDKTISQTKTYGQKVSKNQTKLTNGVKGNSKKNGGVGIVEVVVRKESFWVRLFLFGDMGFAESYMLGEFECEDLTGFFQVRSNSSKRSSTKH